MSRSIRRAALAALLPAFSLLLPQAAAAQGQVEREWREQRRQGIVLVMDVRSGAVVAQLGGVWDGRPLSVAKLFLAALYYQHRPRLRRLAVDIDRVIARGSDEGGRRLALDLRRALGSGTMLDELARWGFPGCSRQRPMNCTGLSPATSEAEWANAFSMGERHFQVTAAGLADFLAMIGRGGLARNGQRVLGAHALRPLQRAMLATVSVGTARRNRDRLAGIGYLGGKSGTSRARDGSSLDGLFAGLIYDRSRVPRFAVVSYVRQGGSGGLLPARIAADAGRALLEGGTAERRR